MRTSGSELQILDHADGMSCNGGADEPEEEGFIRRLLIPHGTLHNSTATHRNSMIGSARPVLAGTDHPAVRHDYGVD